MALVVFQSVVCFSFSRYRRSSFTRASSLATSWKASIISAWVSVGKSHQYQPALKFFQYMPNSSLRVARSPSDFMMSCAVA